MTLTLGFIAGLTSCSYDYGVEQVTLARGESCRGYKLTKVERDGVRLARTSDSGAGSRFYPVTGRPHMRGSHALGNNESLRIVMLDPEAQKAGLEFGWLDWVGPLTMPPF